MEDVVIRSNFDLEGKFWHSGNCDKGVVLVHSFRNTYSELVCYEAAKEFYTNGYSVLLFNFLGHGNSGGKLRDVSFRTTSENVRSAIEYLNKEGILRIGAYAVSLGATATVLSDKQPDAQVFVSPSLLYDPKLLSKRYLNQTYNQAGKIVKYGYATIESGSGRGSFEMGKEWIFEMANEDEKILQRHKRNNIPTLIVQGTLDSLTNVGDAGELISEWGNDSFFVERGDHNFIDSGHRAVVIEKALEWFERHL